MDFSMMRTSEPMQIENISSTLDNRAFILFVLLLSYLVNFSACFFVKFKKTILTYTGNELENKRMNCEISRLQSNSHGNCCRHVHFMAPHN